MCKYSVRDQVTDSKQMEAYRLVADLKAGYRLVYFNRSGEIDDSSGWGQVWVEVNKKVGGPLFLHVGQVRNSLKAQLEEEQKRWGVQS